MGRIKSVVIINSCDQWKSYSSFSLIGVFTTRERVEWCLRKLLKENKIRNESGTHISKMTYNEMHSLLEFVSIEEINVNDIQ